MTKVPVKFDWSMPVRIPIKQKLTICFPREPRYHTIIFTGRGKRSFYRTLAWLIGIRPPGTKCPITQIQVGSR